MSQYQKKVDDARAIAKQKELGFSDITAMGSIKSTCVNVRNAIKLVGVTCEYDKFHDKLFIGGRTIGESITELNDHALLVLRRIIEEKYEFDPGREKIFDACVQLCLENSFDPVVKYLDSLEWDGVDRIDEWLTTYIGAEKTPLNSEIGKIVLIAQVRRAKQPGCKFDQIVVLEGPEGILKSTFLRMLAGADENFSDQTILGQGDKEQQELLRGVWLYEIADLSNIRKAEVEHVKAFASRTHDRARPAYGRTKIDLPRRCVIWATTNNSEYLKSQTGNRQFWPVAVGRIDIESFKRDRDQLFAEAVSHERNGAPIVLPERLWKPAADEQELRREADPWEDALRGVAGSPAEGQRRVFTQELIEVHLDIPKERQTDQQLKRICNCMRILGWQGPKAMRIGAKLGRGFWKEHEETY